MRISMTNFIDRRILVSKLVIAQYCCGKSDTSDWFRQSWRLHVLKYTNQILFLFQESNCTFVATSFRPFARLFLKPAVCECALIPEFAAFCSFVERTLSRCQFSQEGFAQVPFRWSLHGMRLILPDGSRPLGLSAFAEPFTSCDLGCSGEGAG